ncbi:MAG: GTP-binding protein [Tateyamaria sp.]|uniref:CobW family GTP-binding protein n=1 Tax=Tateyamaria sp. TaxID=1929288 RepID=UPI003272035F
MNPLPLSVIGGYLGAGKTTLINRLLAGDHGLRLTILVNDFGAINIDSALLQSVSEDTIELTNGCVCCTLSGDLFYAVGDVLERPVRPDHLLIEASGIADPAKIANVALTEKDLRYSGILTVIDGLNFAQHMADTRIAPQLLAQVHCADMIAVSKTDQHDVELTRTLEEICITSWLNADDIGALSRILFEPELPRELSASRPTTHPRYVTWSSNCPEPFTERELRSLIASTPPGILRLKAVIPNAAGGYFEVHVVGKIRQITRRSDAATLGVIAIGLESALKVQAVDEWWNSTG